MSIVNQAAWLPEKGARLKVDSAEAYEPGPGELLVKNKAVAMNPVDFKIQDYGAFVELWPTILGCDLAGEVAAVGEGVNDFKVGQRVLAHPLGLATKNNASASFQNYTIVLAAAATPIPDNMSFEAASVLPLSLSTASSGLYQSEYLNLPLPTHNPKSTGKTLLVWGGSSSVGCSVIQLAVASGVEVVATASKRNFDMVKKLGATEVFDYTTPSIVGDLVEYLTKKNVLGAYDTIGDRDTAMNTAQVLAELGGGFFSCTLNPPEDVPATVNGKWVFAPGIHLYEKRVGKGVYIDFLPEALKTGQLKPAPDAKVIGHGVESLQDGLDQLKKGVSATKLVVTL